MAIVARKYMFQNNKWLIGTSLFLVLQQAAYAAEKVLTCDVSGYALTAISTREDIPKETVTVKIIEDKRVRFIFVYGSAYYSMGVTSASDSKVEGRDSSTKNAYSISTHSHDTNSDYEIKIDRVSGILTAKNSSSEGRPDRVMISFSGPCKEVKNTNKF